MSKWEIAVWGKDEADLSSGHKRIKEGDIVCYKPYPATWGPEALKKCIIVIVDDLTEADMIKLTSPLYASGDHEHEIDPDIPQIKTAKRRYKIPLSNIEDSGVSLDYKKIRDNKVAYQPFKTKIDTEKGCCNKITVDCGISEKAEVEVTLKITDNVSLIKDTYIAKEIINGKL